MELLFSLRPQKTSFLKAALTLLIFLCICDFSTVQQAYITGKILDNSTHQAIPQASLKINTSQTGTVTNDDGQFMLLLADVKETDSLKISCIGYMPIAYAVSRLKQEKDIVINLVPEVFTLKEVAIVPLTVVEVLKEAIETTNALLPKKTNLNSYYKEFASVDNKIYKFSDAAVDYVISNGDDNTKAKMYIIESRIKTDSATKDNDWRTQIQSFIKSDKAIKSYYNLKYLEEFTKNNSNGGYNFKIAYLGNVAKISIDPREEVKQYLPNVVVYINSIRHTILKVEYNYVTHQKYAPKVNLLVVAVAMEKNLMTAIYSDSDVPLLRYCRIDMDLRGKVGAKKGLFGSVAEVLVHHNNSLDPDVVYSGDEYKKKNIYKNGNHFTEEFWYKYNTILPTEEEMKTLKSELP